MRISIVLFHDFELLDVFGPAELFGFIEGWQVEYLAPTMEPVQSAQGVRVVPDRTYADFLSQKSHSTQLLMIPGGRGTRPLTADTGFLGWLKAASTQADIVSSVCTGAALLACAGILDGHRATSNKRAFEWVKSFGHNIQWERSARWVHDGNLWTSSGIAAGIDMAAALIAELVGEDERDRICGRAEIVITKNSKDDPFAGEPTALAYS